MKYLMHWKSYFHCSHSFSTTFSTKRTTPSRNGVKNKSAETKNKIDKNNPAPSSQVNNLLTCKFKLLNSVIFHLGMVIYDMVISDGESLWPDKSPRTGENRSGRLAQTRILVGWEGGLPSSLLSRPRVEWWVGVRLNFFIRSFAY